MLGQVRDAKEQKRNIYIRDEGIFIFDLKSTKYENWLGSGRRPLNNHQLSQ